LHWFCLINFHLLSLAITPRLATKRKKIGYAECSGAMARYWSRTVHEEGG